MFFLYIILIAFALFGLLMLMQYIFLHFLRIKSSGCKNYQVLCISEPPAGDIEFETRLALSRLEWIDKSCYDGILITDCGLSDVNRNICRAICEKSGFNMISIDNLKQTEEEICLWKEMKPR